MKLLHRLSLSLGLIAVLGTGELLAVGALGRDLCEKRGIYSSRCPLSLPLYLSH